MSKKKDTDVINIRHVCEENSCIVWIICCLLMTVLLIYTIYIACENSDGVCLKYLNNIYKSFNIK